MARFYFDHDVAGETAEHLRQLGHDVLTSRTIHNERAADYRQLLTATEHDRILVSHNQKDFSLLHGAWLVWSAAWTSTAQHGGILIIPQWRPTRPAWQPSLAANELARFVATHPALSSEMHVWRQAVGWAMERPRDI